jgi:hypothetical protein
MQLAAWHRDQCFAMDFSEHTVTLKRKSMSEILEMCTAKVSEMRSMPAADDNDTDGRERFVLNDLTPSVTAVTGTDYENTPKNKKLLQVQAKKVKLLKAKKAKEDALEFIQHQLEWLPPCILFGRSSIGSVMVNLLDAALSNMMKLIDHDSHRKELILKFPEVLSADKEGNESWEYALPPESESTDESVFNRLDKMTSLDFTKYPGLVADFYKFVDLIYDYTDRDRTNSTAEELQDGGGAQPLNRRGLLHMSTHMIDVHVGSKAYLLSNGRSHSSTDSQKTVTQFNPSAGCCEETFCQVYLGALLVRFGIFAREDINCLRIVVSDLSTVALKTALMVYREVIKSNDAYNNDALASQLGVDWPTILPILAHEGAMGTEQEQSTLGSIKKDFFEITEEDMRELSPQCIVCTAALNYDWSLHLIDLALRFGCVLVTTWQSNLDQALLEELLRTTAPITFLLAHSSVDPGHNDLKVLDTFQTDSRNMYVVYFGDMTKEELGKKKGIAIANRIKLGTDKIVFTPWSQEVRSKLGTFSPANSSRCRVCWANTVCFVYVC